jgi:molybdopterin synthase catalytic subunit
MKHLQYGDIHLGEVLRESHHPKSGAVVLFSGEVRNNNNGREVTHLEFEAYVPMAEKMIGRILEEAKSRFKLNLAVCIHRLGTVEINECAVVVVTGAGHRKEAYSANRYIIDRVKGEVPIWKNEFYADGTSEWGHNSESRTNTEAPEHQYEKTQ